ncbi:hypothetical protein [Mesorhizobium caraganae]
MLPPDASPSQQYTAADAELREPIHSFAVLARANAPNSSIPGKQNHFIARRNGSRRKTLSNHRSRFLKEAFMGRGILLWLLGIPIPIIILIMLFVR